MPNKKIIITSLFVLVAFILSAFAYTYNVFGTWQEKITDHLFLKQKVTSSIIILGIDDESLQSMGRWPWERKTFASVIPDLQLAKAIGFDIDFSSPSFKDNNDDLVFKEAINASKVPVTFPLQLRDDSTVGVRPLPLFDQSVKKGFVNIPVDSDGIVRRINNTSNDSERSFSSVVSGQTETSTQNRITFVGPSKSFLILSFADVFEHKIPARIFDNAIVLIGVTANDLHDQLQTPFGSMAGVEVHANAINTLLEKNFLTPIPNALFLLILFLISLLTSLSIVLSKRLSLVIISLSSIFALIILGTFSVFHFHYIFGTLYALLAFIVSGILSFLYSYISEGKEKRMIHKTFQYYLMPDVINELLENPDKLKLGGERKKVTVLFSDIRGFTTLSEKLSPEELTNLLNEYLTLMTDTIMNKRGLVDKYIGDAIMAFWGAPLQNNDQAYDACVASLTMSAELKKLNESLVERNSPTIAIGIGLNTGDVVVGNMGSKRRFNYTIMGDEVNLGSRLEGLTKAYGVECIITEETKKQCEASLKKLSPSTQQNHPQILFRELDRVIVKGKKEPKVIYELLTRPETPHITEILQKFEQGRVLYVQGDFKNAINSFNQALSFHHDGPSAVYIERCTHLIEQPPENWNGVYEFKTK